jgi:hypothetical protein
MPPPDPFPPSPSGAGHATPARATPARAAAALTSQLTQLGITSIYTAAAEKFAVISVTADLNVWTNGHLLWCTHQGQRRTWPAADPVTAAASIAALARP